MLYITSLAFANPLRGAMPCRMPTRSKPAPKPKLTDAERHERFVEMAREVEASEDIEDFDKAFAKVIKTVAPVRSGS